MGLKKLGRVRHHHKFIIVFVVIGVLVIAGVVIVHSLNGPANGTISQTLGLTSKMSTSIPQNQSTYSGQYFSFKLPLHFKTVPQPAASNYLEVVNLFSTDHTSEQVAISVIREDLANDSGLNYRRNHPAIYKAASAMIFSKDMNGSEYTGFLTHNGLAASVSLSSPFQTDLSGVYKAVTDSWQWK